MAVCAILACILASEYSGYIVHIFIAAIALTLIACLSKKLRSILVPALCIFLLFFLWYIVHDARPGNLLTGKLPLLGTVFEEPIDQEQKHRTVITLDDCVINGQPVDYKVRLYVYKNHLGYKSRRF